MLASTGGASSALGAEDWFTSIGAPASENRGSAAPRRCLWVQDLRQNTDVRKQYHFWPGSAADLIP
jgi:hypothetical protein